MDRASMSYLFSRYIDHLVAKVGGDPQIFDVPVRVPDDGRVCAVVFRNAPELGSVTGFSYGLSLLPHPKWQACGRELSITVRSADVDWGKVPARLAGALRGMCPFERKQVLGHMRAYVDGSRMNSVVLSDPVVDFGSVCVDLNMGTGGGALGSNIVEVVGVVPIYAAEREFIRRNGFDEFWAMDWDRLDVTRPPAV